MQAEGSDDNGQAGWVFKPGGQGSSPAASTNSQFQTRLNDDNAITWSASEFISNPKNASWFGLLALGAVALCAIVYLLTHDVVSVVVIAIIGVSVGVVAARQPRTIEYALDAAGVHMGQRFYAYHEFKSFSIVQDGAFSHISLVSLRRFMPPLALHYPPEEEKKIIETLADYLPYEEHKPDYVDSITRRVRF